MIAQRILPAFALLGLAVAQDASACSQATATINSQADATLLAECSTINGDVLIGPNAASTIMLDGPQQIKGSLIAKNAGALTGLSSSTINSISESFNLVNLTILSTLQMSSLTSVGDVEWDSLPALDRLSFTQELKMAKKVLITNTFLSTLDGINLETVGTLDVNNNRRLKIFSTQVGNITETLRFAANGADLAIEFPNLLWAANMDFRNVSSIKFPSLATVNASMGFYGNYIESVAAPNLTSVGNFASGKGSLAFVGNGDLTNISFPALKTVGGACQLANNTDLVEISFPVLAQVGGAIDLSGNFSTPDMPALEDVKGVLNIQSTNQIDCDKFNELGNVVAAGDVGITCKSATDDPQTKDGDSTSTGSDASSTSKSAALTSYDLTPAVAGLSVVGGLLQMLL